jgi:hypothetical protein|tara:strand:+ start:500 stop:664 length:165 start_codon:yes stop_codon:yes gene_type:complete
MICLEIPRKWIILVTMIVTDNNKTLNAAFGEVSVRLFVIAKSFLLSLARLPQRG